MPETFMLFVQAVLKPDVAEARAIVWLEDLEDFIETEAYC
jgi:hypothetical protein